MDRRDRDFHGSAPQRTTSARTAKPAEDAWFESYLAKLVLQPGERVVWRGRPSPWAALRAPIILNTVRTLPFALIGCLMFVVVWPEAFPLAFFTVFTGIALWNLSIPWRLYRRIARAHYLVSDKRVLIVERRREVVLHQLAPAQIDGLELKRVAQGRSNILLRRMPARSFKLLFAAVPFADALWGVDDAEGAMAAVRDLVR